MSHSNIHYTAFENPETGIEIAVAIHYTIIPYIPETGPTYSCGGQPAEGGYAEIEQVLDEDGTEIELTSKQLEYWQEQLYSEDL